MFRHVLLSERQIVAIRTLLSVDDGDIINEGLLRPAEVKDLEKRLAAPA